MAVAHAPPLEELLELEDELLELDEELLELEEELFELELLDELGVAPELAPPPHALSIKVVTIPILNKPVRL